MRESIAIMLMRIRNKIWGVVNFTRSGGFHHFNNLIEINRIYTSYISHL